MFVVAQSVYNNYIFLKSGYFKNLMRAFTLYFSNYHIFKNPCGGRWTRNIITNWSGLIGLLRYKFPWTQFGNLGPSFLALDNGV